MARRWFFRPSRARRASKKDKGKKRSGQAAPPQSGLHGKQGAHPGNRSTGEKSRTAGQGKFGEENLPPAVAIASGSGAAVMAVQGYRGPPEEHSAGVMAPGGAATDGTLVMTAAAAAANPSASATPPFLDPYSACSARQYWYVAPWPYCPFTWPPQPGADDYITPLPEESLWCARWRRQDPVQATRDPTHEQQQQLWHPTKLRIRGLPEWRGEEKHRLLFQAMLNWFAALVRVHPRLIVAAHRHPHHQVSVHPDDITTNPRPTFVMVKTQGVRDFIVTVAAVVFPTLRRIPWAPPVRVEMVPMDDREVAWRPIDMGHHQV